MPAGLDAGQEMTVLRLLTCFIDILTVLSTITLRFTFIFREVLPGVAGRCNLAVLAVLSNSLPNKKGLLRKSRPFFVF